MFWLKTLSKYNNFVLRNLIIILLFLFVSSSISASFIYVPMNDDNQTNHLKAYGIVYYSLKVGLKAKWLLNYDGGAFLIENNKVIENECNIRGVTYQVISNAKAQLILEDISSPSKNQEAVSLEKLQR